MENTTYQMNEGTLAIPGNWRDESMNVFVLPDDSGINLVVSRTPVPAGMDNNAYYEQTLEQFCTHLPGYQEHQRSEITLSQQPARRLDYQWKSPEGDMYQTVVLQIRGTLLLTFNLTSPAPFEERQRDTLLAVINSFQAA
ncbi:MULTISPECIES: DUF1795 domain-containing protein [Photorhabdus]|uniref:DUF1795 domain-containing protein n=1 Tax=Photorhabdus TaxID=29487 RepID=UPI000DCD8893|nr:MULTISPECIES: DUF1795 domain-containing protein [Photorhabdus]MCT8344576.1 DUF1795 domain-containing protein [Photorhabdus kleinii]RAW97493.1 hypothetical protein CKY03_13250 [Photorhabdus sp. S9-53]RAX00128.1 hypothetical protein CKY05_08460 [Photorhabdus sp. S10-54]RAX04461.1 hypothetical protein CKY04_08525 [Photorhabdus sp. S8-52]